MALRTPIGNGIDWKIGVFDTIIGYESSNAGDNPNYSRSWGYTIEPTQMTGISGSYRFCDVVSASFGVANTWNATINGRDSGNVDASKTIMASVALTAPGKLRLPEGRFARMLAWSAASSRAWRPIRLSAIPTMLD